MDEKRKGEIALAIIRYFMRNKTVQFVWELEGELESISKGTKISREEIKKFGKELIDELSKNAFKRTWRGASR